nr:amino acid transporter, transmembrane domain-containing protein [Tanacetum cinerariifolium]
MESTRLPPNPESYSGDGGNDGKEVSHATVDDTIHSNTTETSTAGKGSWKHAAFHVAT